MGEFKRPKYKLHKPSNRAVARFGGREIYLDGAYDSDESRQHYWRLVAEYKSGSVPAPHRTTRREPMTVAEGLDLFTRKRVDPYYVRDGEPTSEPAAIRHALSPLRDLYGSIRLDRFGVRELKIVRSEMIDRGLARTTINKHVSRLRLCFAWLVSEGHYPAVSLVELKTLEGLERGRTPARESKPVRPVEAEDVGKTLPLLPKRVQSIVRLIELTGARPGEICRIRPSEIDRSVAVWEYRPRRHKTEHHGRDRVILIGPQAQAIIMPYLDRTPSAYCFCPADAIADQPWEGARRPQPNRPYNKDSLNKAIVSACRRAGVSPWHANQLRHSAATKIRKAFDLEASRAILGHAKSSTTEIYAERDLTRAREIMGEIG